MDGTITKIKKMPSKFGGFCCLIEVKATNGKMYESWPDDKHGTLRMWQSIISKGIGTKLFGLKIIRDRYIDSNILPKKVKELGKLF